MKTSLHALLRIRRLVEVLKIIGLYLAGTVTSSVQ